jgi:RNA polymerase sigma factor (sigma-70 family)
MRTHENFTETHWSRVLAARNGDQHRAREALAELCQSYWYPIYSYIRRRGHSPDDTEDLTQSFFAELLRPGALAGVDSSKGKFRAYLLARCKNFLSRQRDHDRALKRGGGQEVQSIDLRNAEGRYMSEPAHELTPEDLFDRRWTLALLERVFDLLRIEYQCLGNLALFEALKSQLAGGSNAPSHAELAKALGMTEGSVQVAAHRMRARYREALRSQIAATVRDPSEVDDEIRALFAAVSL